jgi:N-acylneuraminate cytidylyltransferase
MAIKRENNLARINTPINETLRNAVNVYTKKHSKPDIIVILYIEAPFRTSKHIDTAINMLSLFDTDTVIGVRPEVNIIYQHGGSGLNALRSESTLRLEREEFFREVGRFRVLETDILMKKNSLSGNRIGHIVLEEQASLRIDTEFDWEIAKHMAEKIEENEGD